MTTLRARAAALAAVAAIGLSTLTVGVAHATPAAPKPAPKTALSAASTLPHVQIQPNSYLLRNQSWSSPDGSTVLAMQGDGNVVLYRNGTAIWVAPGAMPTANSLVIQGDGNLVAYSATGTPVWNSGTGGHYGAVLGIYDAGAITVESTDSKVIWASVKYTPTPPPCPIMPYPGQIVPPWCWYPPTGVN
ncbi:hypothetical protein [Kitasatospora sp. McL0602]|uniref:hypothetical protein n=1 Tax=Kitasatospora sp. McL0602 TaxID=3439530 RepID=UPI003F8C8685